MEPIQDKKPITKIILSQKEVANLANNSTQTDALARALTGCKRNNKDAQHALERLFAPLIAMLAAKRAGSDIPACTKLIERGRTGLHQAAQNFPPDEPVRQFHLFSLDFIEKAMDKPARSLFRLFK